MCAYKELCILLNTGFCWSYVDSWELRHRAGVVLVWCSCSQYSTFDRVILLSVECPVIYQMQQLLVSMETTHGPFSVFSSSLCRWKAVGGQEEMVAFRERTKWHCDCMLIGRKHCGSDSREKKVWVMYEQNYRFNARGGTQDKTSLTLLPCSV